MELWKFIDEKVKIVDHRNITFIWVITDYIEDYDKDDGLESILESIIVDNLDLKYSEEFNEPRIKSIEIL